MDNNSIIFLPAGDPAGYTSGHFGRVYDYVIAPACRLAGLWPERIENSNTPASDIIRHVSFFLQDWSEALILFTLKSLECH